MPPTPALPQGGGRTDGAAFTEIRQLRSKYDCPARKRGEETCMAMASSFHRLTSSVIFHTLFRRACIAYIGASPHRARTAMEERGMS